MIAWLKCWLGVHVRPQGLRVDWCICWGCSRCGALVGGKLGGKR